ncbi:Metallo-dependent hydrolase [Podospora aff. communis PSN243]|uniref:Probable guanine deaminase n=1 Tax=Podospora aff. communis PSN243 TaxID=3040156 RepID=A0AAV9GAP4_9PEZI|nr:Metallo-dependent hydrolase [Podospora aff. communis PSN243]
MATPPQKNNIFFGTFVHSKTLADLEYLHNTAIAVDAAGKIVAIEPGHTNITSALSALLPKLNWTPDSVATTTSSSPAHFFFPGFIDTHLHASQYPNVGIFGNSTLLDWLNTYTFPLEASLSDPAKARKVYTRVIRKTLAHGTTCAAYYATVDVPSTNLLADLCLAAGQRALVGRVCMDQLSPAYYRDESPEASLAATRESIAYIESIDPSFDIVRPVLTPRFAPSCSAPLLRGLGELAAERPELPIQTHISENKNEIALVKELFPPSATGAGDDSYSSVYDAFGLLTDRTILAHGVHLSEFEAELIAKRGAKVSHCPCSNSAITSGAARVRWLMEKGVTCGLGTDMSGGYSPSVLEAARHAALVSRHVAMGGDDKAKLTVEEVLYLATRGGAEVMGMQGKVGGFEVGMEWDAQLVVLGTVEEDGGVGEEEEDGNVDVFGWESWEDRIAKWVYNGDDRNTRMVWVKGRLVHERK